MKNTKSTLLVSALVLGVLLSNTAQAKFLGQDTSETYASVNDVLRKPIEGDKVSLTGHIVKKIGHHTYLFKDNTAEIPLVISDVMIAFYKDFSPKNKLTVQAEIDFLNKSNKPELIATSLHIDN